MTIISILLAPYRKFRNPWSDHVKQFEYLDWETQRLLAYRQIDKGGFGFWIVFVAGAGFLTDAYDIFAVNTVLPMLAIVYWKGNMPQNAEVLVSLSLLVGTFFGQIIVGILADRYGRKRLYGVELLILTLATVLMSLSSKGALESTNGLAWILSWRFIMGLGIGGDYPLSAVITAEFAPRKHRDRMVSTVFFMQPIGALIANIVTVATVAALRNSLPQGATSTNCVGECRETVDNMWRWIVGLGAVPPAFAILLRWWIPESPRYTLEVEKDPATAWHDVDVYYSPGASVLELANRTNGHSTADTALSPDSTRSTEATLTFGEPEPIEMKELTLTEPALTVTPTTFRKTVRKETWSEFWTGFYSFMIREGNWTDLAGTSLAWMTLDFAFYFLGVNSPKVLSKIWNALSEKEPLDYILMENGNRAMIAVSVGAILGGLLFIKLAGFRWHLQVSGFWILAALFVVVGVSYVVLLQTRYFAAVIVLYSMCSLFFNFGPNSSTFVIAAEVFPTKYRCTCHGLSAAAGKFGSIIAQIFLAYAKFGSPGHGVNDPNSRWLGWVLLVFAAFMASGAIITNLWVPNPCNFWGQSRSLEDLGFGKAARKRMEKDERDAWNSLVPGSPNVP
ncbi:major facilitator superfamily domain-containing protein [Venturia nashicola]|uniref:Major facilitator superfamily domain-containing protein n=1 Tax=Venturia nashicola TaxID=86259 RepID=A0A4Z1PU91_9PEZI|nr:major facilitator superfamily domain-containing protein [Venturia nashicola]TLD38776.1 major facilitator superfamily domain-containing protein [Venturia nashicola]